MRCVLLLLGLSILSGCVHHPKRVDCDQHLDAINAAHRVVKSAATKTP